jgi:hypothetical protein
MNTKPTTDSTQLDQLVNEISLRVGCPLPCMGHEETERTYTEILNIVIPLIREQATARALALCDETDRKGISSGGPFTTTAVRIALGG